MIPFVHHQADAAWQLAVDEYMLDNQYSCGALRMYQWDNHSFTFGYNLSYWRTVKKLGPVFGHPIRRLTGGGLVNHQYDYTFSIVIPRSHPFYHFTAMKSYQSIHMLIQEILKIFGVSTTMCPCSQCDGTRLPQTSVDYCFKNPVAFDLVREKSIFQKVLGSAQKRTRKALLFQGTLNKKALPEVDWCFWEKLFLQTFSQEFSIDSSLQPLPSDEILKNYLLKYRSNQWNQKR